jgi:hypothetical protein
MSKSLVFKNLPYGGDLVIDVETLKACLSALERDAKEVRLVVGIHDGSSKEVQIVQPFLSFRDAL